MVPPPSAKITEKGTETRKRILDVAARLFMEHGYAGTSMNDIIAASGLTKGGFYFHFDRKVDLALEAMELIKTELREEILAEAGAYARAVDQIAALVRAAALNKRRSRAGAALGRLCIELAEVPDVPGQEPFVEWYALVTDLFRHAQRQGDMDPDIDPEVAGHYAVTSYLGLDHVADVLGDPDGVITHVESYLEYTFRAVGIRVPVPPVSDQTNSGRRP